MASEGVDFGTCCGRGSYQISHCERFDKYLDSRYLQKLSFRDRDFGCKVLMTRPFNSGLGVEDWRTHYTRNADRGILASSPISSFFPPNCLPWVRRCALPMVGSRWYGNERQMRSRDPTTETGQPKLRNSRMGLVELAPPAKKAKPGAGDSLYPQIMRNARNGENAKPPVRNERQQTKSDHRNSS